ncbi:MAG: hybrid sensor histidine kinase/response regulator [Bacteroidia bacterium]|nr:hybrid sensor histidine kinase/response regulator [Bacteroidia bacterium]
MTLNNQKYKVFIVDDDPFIRRSLEIKLHDNDQYDLQSFNSGESCIQALAENPDLIIMDYNMGEHVMNGMEAMIKIKELRPSVEVAILSAQDEIPVAVDILNKGAIEYLSKEHVLDYGIERSVAEIIQKKELQDELVRKNGEIREKNRALEIAQEEVLKANKELKELNEELDRRVKKRTAALVNSLNKLKDSKEELENFVYRASHDLKGPTARLLGLIQLSQMLPDDPSNLGYMEEVIKGMDKIVENFIYVHTLHRNPLNKKAIDLEELVVESFEKLKLIPKAKGIQLKYEIEGGKYFASDPLLLNIILQNLLENAIHFHKGENCADRFVNLRLIQDTEKLILEIEDNGQGIGNDIQHKIFQMFYRGSQESHGNGLGLYLVEHAVKKLEGKISIKSEVGRYSKFRIQLPLNLASESTS